MAKMNSGTSADYPTEPIARSSKPRNWTRKRINRELEARGLRQADMVRRSGKAQSVISEVVGGKMKSLPVAAVVAEALGLQPHDIWPRLYAAPASEPATSTDAPMTEPTAGPTALAS